MRTISEMEKARVFKGSSRFASGKIRHAVFHPTEPRLVGFVVHRHDTAGMIKHEDRFLAFDAFDVSDGSLHVRDGRDAWDQGACQRLGVDYDLCTIWKGMPVRTEDGVELGRVQDVEYDEASGQVLGVSTTEGHLANALVGSFAHGAGQVIGFRDGAVMLTAGEQDVLASGGLAELAGTAVGKVNVHMKTKGSAAATSVDSAAQKGAYALGQQIGRVRDTVQEKSSGAAQAADDAVQKGAYALGRQIGRVRDTVQEKGPAAAQAVDDAVQKGAYALGRQIGRTKGMFAAFKEEYDKAVNGDDDE